MYMNDEKRAAFRAAYEKSLTDAYNRDPDRYAYPVTDVPRVVEKMLAELALRGPLGINRNTPAWKAACRACGVKNTAAEIEKFFL